MDGRLGRFKARRARRWLGFTPFLAQEQGMGRCFFLVLLMLAPPAPAQQLDPLHGALDAYAAYQAGVSASLDADIASPDAMDASLARAAQYDPARLARGRIAYGALTAAQSPSFVAGVRARARAKGAAAVVRQLLRDSTYARRRPGGSAEAINLVVASIAADTARLRAGRDHYEAIGQSIGAAAWNTPLDGAQREARQARLRALGDQTLLLAPELAPRVHATALAGAPLQDRDAFGGVGFWDGLAGRAPLPAPTAPRLRSDRAQIMDRVLTLGALFAIGATPAQGERANAMLDDPATSTCLAMQQLEFRQCVSVSHTPDEDAFCLARHGLGGVGDCLGAMVQ